MALLPHTVVTTTCVESRSRNKFNHNHHSNQYKKSIYNSKSSDATTTTTTTIDSDHQTSNSNNNTRTNTNTLAPTTSMTPFTLSPLLAVASINNSNKINKNKINNKDKRRYSNHVYFATALFAFYGAVSHHQQQQQQYKYNQQQVLDHNHHHQQQGRSNMNILVPPPPPPLPVLQKNSNRKNTPSYFPGTVTVSAAVATTAMSSITSRALAVNHHHRRPTTRATRRPTMVALSAGSTTSTSRTLIELGPSGEKERTTETSNTDDSSAAGMNTVVDDHDYTNYYCNAENNCKYEIDVTYLDEDYEQGLLILRRAKIISDDDDDDDTINIIDDQEKAAHRIASTGTGSTVQRVLQKGIDTVAENPFVAMVVAGNLASMMGILPVGMAGFLPALGVVLGRSAAAGRNRSGAVALFSRFFPKQKTGPTMAATKAVLSKLKFKLTKFVSRVYKNRSKYSLLSDYCWYVQGGDNDTTSNDSNKAQK